MDSIKLHAAISKYILIGRKWTSMSSDRAFFTRIWPNCEVLNQSKMHNHFFTKMQNSDRNGFSFLLRLDRSNFYRAISAVCSEFDQKDMLIAKDFYLYLDNFGSRWELSGSFCTMYESMSEECRTQVLETYLNEGHHLRV